MERFTVTNNATGRSYIVHGQVWNTLELYD